MKTLAPGVAIIGNYMPSFDIPSMIGNDILRYTTKVGLRGGGKFLAWTMADWFSDELAAEVRTASHKWIKDPDVGSIGKWHSDANGDDLALVIWSNCCPTEIRLPDGTVIVPEPGDIAVIRNSKVEHRTPLGIPDGRIFFRQTCAVPEWL